jgi:CRISPR-associated endonuclease Cas2
MLREKAYIVAYDIALARRRARVARYLEARGERVQKSMAARRLKRALEGLIDAATDRLMVEPMAGRGFERPQALIF